MIKVIRFLATSGIAFIVLALSDYEANDIRHWIPVTIVAILLIIKYKTEVKK